MYFPTLRQDNEWQDYAHAAQKKREEESSGGIWHDFRARGEKRDMKQLRREKENQSPGKRMQEIFHTKNAYGEISLGMNEKGETALVAGRNRYQNGPTVENNERELNETNSYRWRNAVGFNMTNKKDPKDSAFGFQSPAYEKMDEDRETVMYAKAIVEQTQRFAGEMEQHTAEAMFPRRESAIGATKTWDSRSLKLSHQLSLAMEEGKKRIAHRYSEDELLWNRFRERRAKMPEEDGEDHEE